MLHRLVPLAGAQSKFRLPEARLSVCVWQGDSGWDILRALQHVKAEADECGDAASAEAATAVEKRVRKVSSPSQT